MSKTALAILVMALPCPGIEIIAHRGASYDAPENTLPAVTLAWERNADAVEMDGFLSKDGHVVAIHDKDTGRVAGDSRKVSDQTLAELKAHDVGSWKDAKYAGTHIPTVTEVLATVPDGKPLGIEVKGGNREIVPALEKALDAAGKREQVNFIAFDYDLIVAAKERMPDVPSYWLYGFSARERVYHRILSNDDLIEKAKKANLDGLDFRHDGDFDKAFVDKVRAEGMEVLVYTVNSPARARELEAMGVSGVPPARPGFMRKALRR